MIKVAIKEVQQHALDPSVSCGHIAMDVYVHVYFNNPTRYSDKLFQNLKRGTISWDQLFSVHFFVRNMGKVVPPPNKNSVFF